MSNYISFLVTAVIVVMGTCRRLWAMTANLKPTHTQRHSGDLNGCGALPRLLVSDAACRMQAYSAKAVPQSRRP